MTTRQRVLLFVALGIVALAAVPVLLFRARYCRGVVVRDLGATSTQTVSVAFHPSNMRWKISGDVQGTGTIFIPYVFSNSVSGAFSTNGAGDYYETNVDVIFIPQGRPSGEIRASFFLNDFF